MVRRHHLAGDADAPEAVVQALVALHASDPASVYLSVLATIEDLRWWTGWNLTTTRRALKRLPIEEVDLHGQPGIDLADADREIAEEPAATLLPTLDPTPMGWKIRDWFLGIDPGHIFDRAGNIGPTLWWDGEIVGSWGITPDADLR
jgi:hypothetical protein